jgi:hypothetical protein
MRNVKILTDVMDVARRAADRWYVTTGDTAVGPVNLDLIARGVEAGKVPLGAFVRHEGWRVWRRISELAEITGDEPSLDDGARLSTDDMADLGRPSTPEDFLPADAIDGAADRRDALVLLMTAAVVRGGADAAIVHEIDDDGAVVVCAHGATTVDVLGMRTSLADPAVAVAATGATVIARPIPGPAGQAIVDRLSLLAGPMEGALMIPIRPSGRLAGVLELGRRAAFGSAEIASLEALVEALAAKLEGWARA